MSSAGAAASGTVSYRWALGTTQWGRDVLDWQDLGGGGSGSSSNSTQEVQVGGCRGRRWSGSPPPLLGGGGAGALHCTCPCPPRPRTRCRCLLLHRCRRPAAPTSARSSTTSPGPLARSRSHLGSNTSSRCRAAMKQVGGWGYTRPGMPGLPCVVASACGSSCVNAQSPLPPLPPAQACNSARC